MHCVGINNAETTLRQNETVDERHTPAQSKPCTKKTISNQDCQFYGMITNNKCADVLQGDIFEIPSDAARLWYAQPYRPMRLLYGKSSSTIKNP
jgi:hypothetical protein